MGNTWREVESLEASVFIKYNLTCADHHSLPS